MRDHAAIIVTGRKDRGNDRASQGKCSLHKIICSKPNSISYCGNPRIGTRKMLIINLAIKIDKFS